jgi:hypothetical protein
MSTGILRDVHPDNVLKLKSGTVVRNLYELANELALIDEETFTCHVNRQKNDFYDWIYHIVRDDHLARVFAQIKDRRMMLAAVEKRIKDLETFQQPPRDGHFHLVAKHYLLGIVIGAMAMLMVSQLL